MRMQLTLLIATVALTVYTLVPVLAKDNASLQVEKVRSNAEGSESAEATERKVDKVAIASQEKAISKLSSLLKKYRGTRQEPILLAKLGELQQQNAAMYFRLAHGRAHQSHKPVDLSQFKKVMNQSISTLSELIHKYPGYEEIPQVYFMRAKGFHEIELKESAIRDYLHLVNHFPEIEEAIPSYMALAEFAIEANDHPKAISYLNKVEQRPDTQYHPFALYKLAWSHYNLKNIPKALSYSERHIDYYNRKMARDKDEYQAVNTSDAAIRENMLLDSVVFFADGLEQSIPQYQVPNALAYFKKLDTGPTAGQTVGRMSTRFSKLLRSQGHETDLILWKDQLMESETDRPETLESLLVTYEHLENKRRFPLMISCANDMSKLYKLHKEFESFPKAQKTLLDTADTLQKLIVKNKGANGVEQLSITLASIYDAFTRIVEETDPRIPRVHYNLAETLFEIKDYPRATDNYRWIVEHESSWDPKKTLVADASLKAISSRYETLREKKMIPTELTAKPLKEDSDKDLNPLLGEWVTWIDTHISKAGPIENFEFEADRAIYGQSHLKDAIERMRDFIKKRPNSKYSKSLASLVLDTYIVTADWQQTYEVANNLLEVKAWKNTPFAERLVVAASDAHYKIMEQAYRDKNYKETLEKAEDFITLYPKSKRLPDTYSMAASAALAISDKKRAGTYLSRLIAEAPTSENVASALLSRAGLYEERYEFSGAAQDYRTFLELPEAQTKGIKLSSGKLDDVRKKTLMLAWLATNPRDLEESIKSKAICTPNLHDSCDLYSALKILTSPAPISEALGEQSFDRFKKASDDNKTLWAAVALGNTTNLEFKDRLSLIRAVSVGWDDLDPIIKFSLIPRLSLSIPHAFDMNREEMKDVAPLKPNAKYITRRVEVIREMENAATKVMKLPWARIRATVLNTVARLYLDIARDLSNMKAPKMPPEELAVYEETIRKIVMPFEEKGQEISSKAFEIASRSSIEDESFKSVAEPFYKDNPSLAKTLRPEIALPAAIPLTIASLKEFDDSYKWDKPDFQTEERAELVKAYWSTAVRIKAWQQIAFFTQEAQDKKLIPSATLGMMRAVSFAQAGAKAEALAEFEDTRKEFESDSMKIKADLLLLSHFLNTSAKEQVTNFLKTLSDYQSRTELENTAYRKYSDASEAFSVAYGLIWTKFKIRPELLAKILRDARSKHPERMTWINARLDELNTDPGAVANRAVAGQKEKGTKTQ